MALTPTGHVPDPAGDVVVVSGTYQVEKADDELGVVFGWANISVHKDAGVEVDAHGDVIPPDVLEKAAYEFVLEARASGQDHTETIDGELVESMFFSMEKQRALGIPEGTVPQGWWVGFKLSDEGYESVKSGERPMFSIEGTAHSRMVEVDA